MHQIPEINIPKSITERMPENRRKDHSLSNLRWIGRNITLDDVEKKLLLTQIKILQDYQNETPFSINFNRTSLKSPPSDIDILIADSSLINEDFNSTGICEACYLSDPGIWEIVKWDACGDFYCSVTLEGFIPEFWAHKSSYLKDQSVR